jgi:hypothetical protein
LLCPIQSTQGPALTPLGCATPTAPLPDFGRLLHGRAQPLIATSAVASPLELFAQTPRLGAPSTRNSQRVSLRSAMHACIQSLRAGSRAVKQEILEIQRAPCNPGSPKPEGLGPKRAAADDFPRQIERNRGSGKATTPSVSRTGSKSNWIEWINPSGALLSVTQSKNLTPCSRAIAAARAISGIEARDSKPRRLPGRSRPSPTKPYSERQRGSSRERC